MRATTRARREKGEEEGGVLIGAKREVAWKRKLEMRNKIEKGENM